MKQISLYDNDRIKTDDLIIMLIYLHTCRFLNKDKY